MLLKLQCFEPKTGPTNVKTFPQLFDDFITPKQRAEEL
jgi:hypothetical protein